MSRHPPCDRVDRVLDLDVALLKLARQLADCVLGLRDGHSIAGNNHHLAREGHLNCRIGGARCADRAAVLASTSCASFSAAATKAAGDDARNRAVHRVSHQSRQDRARGADDHAGNDQRRVVERQSGGRRGEACEGVQQRDNNRHVGAADRQHDEESEQRRSAEQHEDVDRRRLAAGNRDRRGQRDQQQDQVQRLLQPASTDRMARQNLLQLAEGNV